MRYLTLDAGDRPQARRGAGRRATATERLRGDRPRSRGGVPLAQGGQRPATAAEAAEEWANRRAERRLYALLAPHGLARYVGELISIHGIHAAEEVRDDPYSLTEVSGIGFLGADRVARRRAASRPDSQRRMRAAAVHALREAENRGHTHLPRGGADRGDRASCSADRAVDGGAAGGSRAGGRRGRRPQPRGPARSTAAGPSARRRGWRDGWRRWRAPSRRGASRRCESEFADLGLTEQQREAATNALTRRLSVITGGPGTGKTHLTDALVRMCETRDLEIRLLAPTGRAARRLTQATDGAPAIDDPQGARVDPGRDPRPRRGLADRGRPGDRRRGVDALAGDLPAR